MNTLKQAILNYQIKLSQFDAAPADCNEAAILELHAAMVRVDNARRELENVIH